LCTGKVKNGPSVYDVPCFERRINNGQIEIRVSQE